MYIQWLFMIISAVVVQVHSGKGDPCTTPYGYKGICTPLHSCPTLLKKINPNNQSTTQFAQDSLCGWEGIAPMVCCENHPEPLGRSVLFQLPLITLENFNTSALPDRSICGLQTIGESPDDRIVGGEQTIIGEFPWMVALEYKTGINQTEIDCGGSLINTRFILTAAHCVVDTLIGARLGEHNTTSDPDCLSCDSVVKVGIIQKIPHPHYDTRTKNHDIALLEMEKEVAYTDFIRPICIPPLNMPPLEYRETLTVAGWGSTENASRSDVKLKVDVPLLANQECQSILIESDPSLTLEVNQMCAGGNEDKDSCRGDSGGPLMRLYVHEVDNKIQWYIEGIVSRGLGCGRVGRPAIYTRVNRYIYWILNNITPN